MNHVDMVFATDVKGLRRLEGWERRVAAVRVNDDEHPWRWFVDFADEERRKDVRNHVLRSSVLATEWSQIAVGCSESVDGKTVMDDGLPEDATPRDALNILRRSVELWAEIRSQSYDVFKSTASAFILLADWSPMIVNRIVVRKFVDPESGVLPMKINDRNTLKAKYGDSDSWVAFSDGVCKNKYMKQRLFEIQGGMCPICDRRLDFDTAVIHHVDYDHECEHAKRGVFWELQGSGMRRVPDCQSCSEISSFFSGCADRLRLTHRSCNYLAEITQ